MRGPQIPKQCSVLLSKLRFWSLCYFYHDVQWQRCVLFSLTGSLIPRHQELFYKNPVFAGVRLPEIKETEPLERHYPRLSEVVMDLAKVIILPFFTSWQGLYIMETQFSLLFSCLVDILCQQFPLMILIFVQ